MQLSRGCCIVIQLSNQLMTLMYIECIFQEYETLVVNHHLHHYVLQRSKISV